MIFILKIRVVALEKKLSVSRRVRFNMRLLWFILDRGAYFEFFVNRCERSRPTVWQTRSNIFQLSVVVCYVDAHKRYVAVMCVCTILKHVAEYSIPFFSGRINRIFKFYLYLIDPQSDVSPVSLSVLCQKFVNGKRMVVVLIFFSESVFEFIFRNI